MKGCIYKVGSRKFRLKRRASKYARKHGRTVTTVCKLNGLGARTKQTARKSRPSVFGVRKNGKRKLGSLKRRLRGERQ